MDTKEIVDVTTDEHVLVPDSMPAPEDAEDVPAIAMHPLVVAMRQLEILQNQVFLAGPASNIQALSTDNGTPTGEDTGPYCRLACDVLSCTVSACELWRESLLRHPGPANTNYPPISTAELYRLLAKLLASMHILDCLKDSKQALRIALSAVTAQEGDEQHLLTAVQDFFHMPTACLVLLRDMLLEQPEALAQTKIALFKLLEFQLAAVDGVIGQEADRKWGSLKSKLGLSTGSLHAGDQNNGHADMNIAARSSARIALSLLVHLYCCVDSFEQDLLHSQTANTDSTAGVTPKVQAMAMQRLRTCLTTLRATPIVPGYGDVSIDLLKPLHGLPQLGPPWDAPTSVEAAALEERYCLSAMSSVAATDYGRVVEEILTLKLQYESDKQRLAEEGRNSSGGGSSGATDMRTSTLDAGLAGRTGTSQAAMSRAVGALAFRAIQLLKDWQAAVLQLDAFRTWQRRLRLDEEEAAAAAVEGANADGLQPKTSMPRCAFTPTDMAEVVRLVSYIKGLHGVLCDNMTWMEPLLRMHCAAHLAQLLNSVVVPISSGALGLPQPTPTPPSVIITASPNAQPRTSQLPPLARGSCGGMSEAQPLSAPSSARGTGTCSVPPSAVMGPTPEVGDVGADVVPSIAAGIGRMWKARAFRHGRTRSTVSSLEAMASEAAHTAMPPPSGATRHSDILNFGPSQRTTEDSADTVNLIASITADGVDWALARPGESRNDPYARLREWFAAGGSNPHGGAAVTCLNAPLQPVPEGQTPTSERLPSAATINSGCERKSRRSLMPESAAEAASILAAGNASSTACEQQWPGSSGARIATTGTDGTEDGVECTVSSVSDCEGLMAGLDSEDEACDSGDAIADDGTRPRPGDKVTAEGQAPSPQPQQNPQQPWSGTDLLWPQPPVPSASWLSGNAVSPANATTVSAGGASNNAGMGRSPVAGAPRVTAPAALSTNPLYVYPSAAREAVAEKERATVAIWIASEGGALAPPALAGAEQDVVVATNRHTTAEGATGGEAITPRVHQPRPQLDQRTHDLSDVQIGYGDDLGATPQVDSAARQHSCYEGSNNRLAMRPCDDAPSAYGDDFRLSHGHLDLPQPDFTDTHPSLEGAQTNTDVVVAPQPQVTKKPASSPFKRIKKLFSKRSAAVTVEKASAATGDQISSSQYDDTVIAAAGVSDPALEVYYGGADFPATVAGFGALPAPYLADPREIASLELDSSALLGMQGANYGAFGVGMAGHNAPTASGEFLPGVMEEAAARDGAVAVLSVGPAGQVLGAQTEEQPSGDSADSNAAGGRAGGKPRTSAGGGLSGGVGGVVKGAAAFLEIAARAREEQSCQRLRIFANEMQVCLAHAGLATGADRTSAAACKNVAQRSYRGSRKGLAATGARASFKKLVTSIKGKSIARNRSGGGSAAAADQDAQAWTCDAAQRLGLDAQGFTRLRNSAELMAEELARMLNQRRDRGKGTKDGPSTMQLLALSSELRNFLTIGLPSLEPLLEFRGNLAAAADMSALLLLDPSRSYGTALGNGLAADARGSVPWELANKGVLLTVSSPDGIPVRSAELPLSSGLTVLTLFKDAIEALQMQQAQATFSGYPEPQTAARLQLMYRRQAKWCLGTFMQMAARRVWGTYKAQAMRSKLGLVVPPGAPDVAASTVAFEGLFRPLREDMAAQELLLLANTRSDMSVDIGVSLIDHLTGAIDDLVRQSATRTADLLLGSDLTSLVAVKQQLDVYSAAVTRLRQELPGIRPWKDVWLAALAARAVSSPTCSAISESAAATAAAVTQGCGSNAAGITLSSEDIILMHACSVAALRTLSTWSYDMVAVKFRPTKHTKVIWESFVGSSTSVEASSSSLLFPDGADMALASVAVDMRQGGRASDVSGAFFGRAHVQALHSLLGLTGIGRWVAALRRHAVDLLADAAPLLRRVHEMYDTSLAGPRGPSMRESGGASGYLQLQQRWLRDRGHSELLVSAHRAMQALGNTVAAVALTDSVLAELCMARAPHLLPLAASAMQADHQAHAALKAMANADAATVPIGTGMVKPAPVQAVAPPPRGAGLAGLLLGQPLPPGLMSSSQSAVQAASLVQERLQGQLPVAFGLPGLWRALHECLHPLQTSARSEPLLMASRLWSVVQVQLSCLTPDEQVVHTANVGDGVYVSAAALVQLAAGAPIAPGSVLHGDTMTQLQQAVALEQLKFELSVASAHSAFGQMPYSGGMVEKATLDQLKAWSARAEVVRAAWDRAVQLTVGAGMAAKPSGQRTPWADSSASQTTRALDTPALVSCSGEAWMLLAQQASATGMAMIVRAAAAAIAPTPQSGAQQQANGNSQGAPGSRGQTGSQGRPASQPGLAVNQTMPPLSRNAPPRPPTNAGSQQPGSATATAAGLHRISLNGPPLPPRGGAPSTGANCGRSTSGHINESPVTHPPQPQQQPVQQQAAPLPPPQQAQQQPQPLQQIRAASHVLMKSPRGDGSGAYGLFTIAGSTAAQSRSRAASSLGDWGNME
ncbi:hypothetical protein Vretimale_16030 [Volvox reticuliferus]|uniref:Uncharacterized protein n=1 Tax=Volvox reticuliferus TaxID=1737510 RepID=A0A8J4FQS4_9CHLO|nr:hypothetical protein Vretifemale_9732 [Volvox reticuliferus]GIM12787.1 hypothetical protein Vretimale_16030 [Volvox reticuliferus]